MMTLRAVSPATVAPPHTPLHRALFALLLRAATKSRPQVHGADLSGRCRGGSWCTVASAATPGGPSPAGPGTFS